MGSFIYSCANGHCWEAEPLEGKHCSYCSQEWTKIRVPGADRIQKPRKIILDWFDHRLGQYVYDVAEEKRVMKEKGLCDVSGTMKIDYPGRGTVFSFPKGKK